MPEYMVVRAGSGVQLCNWYRSLKYEVGQKLAAK